jgi:hypothetical protein
MSDHSKFLKQCEEKGCTVERRKSGYYRVTAPGGGRIRVSATPSSQNWLNRAKADLRRLGVDF